MNLFFKSIMRGVFAITLGLLASTIVVEPAHAARTAPIVVVQDEAFPVAGSQAQVDAAVLQALSGRGWTILSRARGQVEAQYARRNFSATIVVTYTTRTLTIRHKESTGLNYDEAAGKIHPNYNRWIANLKLDIQRFVSNAAMGVPS